jgi:hypothetical protein
VKIPAILALMICLLGSVGASGAPFSDFSEEIKNPVASKSTEKIRQAKRAALQDVIIGSVRQNYAQFTNRVIVPGFISSAALTDIATLAGPNNLTASFRIGDTAYFSWVGTPGPREGARYVAYTPAVVLQSVLNPTDFIIRARPKRAADYPENYRMAGHFYESNGTIRITKIKQGLVEGVIESLSGQISIGDQLMPTIPVKTNIQAATGGIQLAAAVVAGSPVDRLSTTKRSFIYINRGSRDGIREGRIFQAVESVPVDRAITNMAPEISVGEAMVVHVSDSYSTAMITRQFDVIRMGSLLKTKQELSGIESNEPFRNLFPGAPPAAKEDSEEIPNLGDMSLPVDDSLPEPAVRRRPPEEPALSELDALEKAGNFNSLTPEEKSRLGRLSRQEKLEEEGAESLAEESPLPAPVDNSFRQGKPKKAAKKPKAKRSNDEEELNLLMMEN